MIARLVTYVRGLRRWARGGWRASRKDARYRLLVQRLGRQILQSEGRSSSEGWTFVLHDSRGRILHEEELR